MLSQSGTAQARAVGVVLVCLGVSIVGTIVGSRAPDLSSSASAAPSRDIEMYSAIVTPRSRRRRNTTMAVGARASSPSLSDHSGLQLAHAAAVLDAGEGARGRGRVALVGLCAGAAGGLCECDGGSVAGHRGDWALFRRARSFVHRFRGDVMSEAWAGVLVGLSMCAYLKGADRIGAATRAAWPCSCASSWRPAPCFARCSPSRTSNSRAVDWVVGAVAYAVDYAWHLRRCRLSTSRVTSPTSLRGSSAEACRSS